MSYHNVHLEIPPLKFIPDDDAVKVCLCGASFVDGFILLELFVTNHLVNCMGAFVPDAFLFQYASHLTSVDHLSV